MCLIVASNPDVIFPGYTGETRCTVEAPCGHGFVDVLAETIAPAPDVESCVIEVKTRYEHFLAGDVIRQLKWYVQRLPERLLIHLPRMMLVVEDVDAMPGEKLALILHEGIEVLPVSFFEKGAAA